VRRDKSRLYSNPTRSQKIATYSLIFSGVYVKIYMLKGLRRTSRIPEIRRDQALRGSGDAVLFCAFNRQPAFGFGGHAVCEATTVNRKMSINWH
jgi:hypothetical protein